MNIFGSKCLSCGICTIKTVPLLHSAYLCSVCTESGPQAKTCNIVSITYSNYKVKSYKIYLCHKFNQINDKKQTEYKNVLLHKVI